MKKVALVTGSARGIGKAIADKLQSGGYTVVYSATREYVEGLENYCKCDVSKAEDRKKLLQYIDERFGRLDLLVNNAGVACLQRLDVLETTEESFDRLLSINTKGAFFMCQAFARYMIAGLSKDLQDYQPRIVNITSISSGVSSVSRGEYCVSKAAASMVSTLFADRLGEYGIPVLEIQPGIIKTDMTACVTEKYDKLIAEGVSPMRRWGQPEDVANCVFAVANGLLDFCTGSVICVDGGLQIKRL